MARLPYPGLRPFERDEGDIFFGRETHVDSMIDRLAQRRFLAVTGSSGSGKSSLVRAGLLEALETGLMAEAGSLWRIAVMRPREHPMSELAGALLTAQNAAHDPEATALRRAALERGPLSLVDEFHSRPLPQGANFLILVDQFEELFRYQSLLGREEAEAFVALLLTSAAQREIPIYVLLTMRSDFLGRCAEFSGLAETVTDAQYLCPRLNRGQIAAAIEEPARVFGGEVEKALVARIINDMGADPDQLPLMQHALMRLWNEASATNPEHPVLRLADYLAEDGLKGSLSRHADEILAAVAGSVAGREETVRRLFCLMVDGEGDGAVRRPAPVSEIMAVTSQALDAVSALADPFRAHDVSFLNPGPERPLNPESLLDINHEALIRQWQTLRQWTHAEAASAEQYRETERRARRWDAGQAPLWDAADLDIALAWRERERPSAAWAERYGHDFALAMRFLDESAARRDALVRRLAWRRHMLTTAMGVLIVVFAGLAWFGFDRAREARHQQLLAEASAKEAQHQQLLAEASAKEAAEMQVRDLADKQEADRQKLVAQQNLQLVTDAMKELLDTVQHNNLPPGIGTPILDSALTLVNRLLDQSGGDAQEFKGAQATALNTKAITLRQTADLKNALIVAKQAQLLRQAFVGTDMPPPEAVSSLAIVKLAESDKLIGLILIDQKNQADAVRWLKDSLALHQALVARDPDNREWQYEAADDQETIGDALPDDPDNALVAYRAAVAILLAQSPDDGSPEQLRTAQCYRKMGDLMVQLKPQDAIAAYRRGQLMLQFKVPAQTVSEQWRQELARIDGTIGDLLRQQDDPIDAIDAYRDQLAVQRILATMSPDDFARHRDVADTDDSVGEMLRIQRDYAGALSLHQEALSIRSALAHLDPDNGIWQDAMRSSNIKIGDALRAKGDYASALGAYRTSLDIASSLVAANLGFRDNRWLSHQRIGTVYYLQDNYSGAVAELRSAADLIRAQLQIEPSNQDWRTKLAGVLSDLAFYSLMNRHPQEALDSVNEAERYDPSAEGIIANRADALLLLGRFDDAKAIYLANRDLAPTIKEDFAAFRRAGINTPDMKKIEALLGI